MFGLRAVVPSFDTHEDKPVTFTRILLNVTQDSFEEDLLEIFDFMAPEDSLLLFGDGNLILISAIASRLEERGYRNITIMTGGLDQWSASGGMTAEARHE